MKVSLLYPTAYSREAQFFIFCVNGGLLSDTALSHKIISGFCNKMPILTLQIPFLFPSPYINPLENILSLLNFK